MSSRETSPRIRTLPPIQRERERTLDPRRELTASALVAASMLVPFGLGALLGRLPAEVPLEPRAAWVVALATCFAVAAACVQRQAPGRARFLPAAALVLPLGHSIWPGSPLLASLDALAFVIIAALVAAIAPLRFLLRHHGSRPRARFVAVAILVTALPGPLLTTGWGLASSIVVPAIARLLHPTPEPVGEERFTELTTDDGLTLRGTYWPGLSGAPAIVLVHGLHDARDHMLGWARALNARGAHVLAYDARAHGASDGAVLTFADREPGDVVRAAEHLISLSHAAPDRVALLGLSMGGGAVLRAMPAMSDRGSHRAVLFAPASDYAAIVGRYLPPSPVRSVARAIVLGVSHALGFLAPLELIPGDALDEAPESTVLVVHARGDRTIPLSMSELLAREHPSVTLRAIDGDHDHLARTILEAPELRELVISALGISAPSTGR